LCLCAFVRDFFIQSMNVLITGAGAAEAKLAIEVLQAENNVRAIDVNDGDLRDAAFAAQVVQGVDVILHFAPISLSWATDEDNLDHATRGTYYLAHAAAKAGVKRIIQASTLKLFDVFPANYKVDPSWRARPQAQIDHLCARMAEITLRETVRDLSRNPTTQLRGICLRLGEVTRDEIAEALQQALTFDYDLWGIRHVGKRSSSIVHRPSSVSSLQSPISNFPRRVVIFGSGGPLASSTAKEMAQGDYVLRQTDVRPLADVLAENKPQLPGAPLPTILAVPHEERLVDVTDYAQVLAASEGMDAIINCTVIRHSIDQSFRVNLLGAFNVMRAAVAHGIRRVVHTGPFMLGQKGAGGYYWDDYLVDDIPARPGDGMVSYIITKLLGQEVCRIYAEQYQLEVPTLTFAGFYNPEVVTAGLATLAVSWADAARAIRCAVEVPNLPSPYEYMHIGADTPLGVFPNDKAKRILNWQPQDDLHQWWLGVES